MSTTAWIVLAITILLCLLYGAILWAAISAGSRSDDENEALHKKDRHQ